ncbi:thioesterase family protein [Caballeronia sp. HLA56]
MGTIYRDTVKAEWVDYNGHLRDAYYMLIFSLATDAFMDGIGLDDAGRRARQRTLYTLEAHVSYLREIKEGAAVRVDAWVVARDKKRVHLYLEMFEADEAEPVSACEQMMMHIDSSGAPKSASFDEDVARSIDMHAVIAPCDARYAGRVIGLPARSAGTSVPA